MFHVFVLQMLLPSASGHRSSLEIVVGFLRYCQLEGLSFGAKKSWRLPVAVKNHASQWVNQGLYRDLFNKCKHPGGDSYGELGVDPTYIRVVVSNILSFHPEPWGNVPI